MLKIKRTLVGRTLNLGMSLISLFFSALECFSFGEETKDIMISLLIWVKR